MKYSLRAANSLRMRPQTSISCTRSTSQGEAMHIHNSAIFRHQPQHRKLLTRKRKLLRITNTLFAGGMCSLAIGVAIPVILLWRPSSISTWSLLLTLGFMMVGLGGFFNSLRFAVKVREVTASIESKIWNLTAMLGLDDATLCGMEVSTIKERGEKRLVALAERALIYRHASKEIQYGAVSTHVAKRVQRYIKRTQQSHSDRLGDLYDLMRELELTVPGGYEWAYAEAKKKLPF